MQRRRRRRICGGGSGLLRRRRSLVGSAYPASRRSWRRRDRGWAVLRLRTLRNFRSFRGVCTSWRSVGAAAAEDVMASYPPIFFCASVPIWRFSLESFRCRFYHPRENRFYVADQASLLDPGYLGSDPFILGVRSSDTVILGVSHGYFITARCSGLATIVNPLTGEEKDCFPRSSRALRLGLRGGGGGALLSSPPTTSPAGGCVLVQWDPWNIQYCRPGDKEWCQVVLPPVPPPPLQQQHGAGHLGGDVVVLSVAVLGGKGYALIDGVGIGSFDLAAAAGGSSTVLTVLREAAPDAGRSWYSSRVLAERNRFLAEHGGELFALKVVERCSGRVAEVVCRFDPSSGKWAAPDNLGGRSVLVVPPNTAMFMEGASIERCGGSRDCIYAFNQTHGLFREYTQLNRGASSSLLRSPRHHHRRSYNFASSDSGCDSYGCWVRPNFLVASDPSG